MSKTCTTWCSSSVSPVKMRQHALSSRTERGEIFYKYANTQAKGERYTVKPPVLKGHIFAPQKYCILISMNFKSPPKPTSPERPHFYRAVFQDCCISICTGTDTGFFIPSVGQFTPDGLLNLGTTRSCDYFSKYSINMTRRSVYFGRFSAQAMTRQLSLCFVCI